MQEQADIFRCRYCRFTVLKWRTLAGGRKRSGWRTLQAHIEQEHPQIEVPDLMGDDSNGETDDERTREVPAGQLHIEHDA